MPTPLNHTLIHYILFIATLLTVSACATSPRQHPAPDKDKYAQAEVVGFSDIRFWGDRPPKYLNKIVQRIKENLPNHPEWTKRNDILALSGGAEDGAYGAGFLEGWTERGNRPDFFMVTGVSTGALIAPFAFLGSEYDDRIKHFYTETSKQNIFFLTPLTALFGGSAIGDTTPLRDFIRKEVNDEMVAKIAEKSRSGRLLLIATTHLEAQRSVIWDIGRIAESGNPNATKLIGDIMLASASVPGAFPPVIIDVTINGKRYQEAHVDGGVTSQIFTYPVTLNIREIQKQINNPGNPERNIWMIRNTKISPEYKENKLNVPDIVGRSISTLIKYQGIGDLIRSARLAKRDGYHFHITYVPADFDQVSNDMFDTKYMRSLYKIGYDAGLSGKGWDYRLNQLFDDSKGAMSFDMH